MEQSRPRQYHRPGPQHPLSQCGPDIVAGLRVVITSRGPGEYPVLHDWSVQVVADPDADVDLPSATKATADEWDRFRLFADPTLVSTMRLHTVALWGHSVIDAGDAESSELEGLLSSAFDEDNEPLPPLTAAMEASSGYSWWTPSAVATVDEFRVAPQWRGTILTPYLAALVLSHFAILGHDAFLLTAHPIIPDAPDRATDVDLRRAQRKIAAMYRLLGFQQYDPGFHLAGWFPERALDGLVNRLRRDHPGLLR